MKTDKFEDFIRQNRQEFAPESPTPDVWGKVTKRQPEAKTRQISWRKFVARAASVTIIFIASYYFHDYMSGRNKDNPTFIASENASNPLYEELQEADLYYTAQISSKKQELFTLTDNQPGLQMDVNNDLDDLDVILLELKEDLKDNADNQEVVEAMMQNYRLKLEILEDMLEQIKGNQEKTENHESGYSI